MRKPPKLGAPSHSDARHSPSRRARLLGTLSSFTRVSLAIRALYRPSRDTPVRHAGASSSTTSAVITRELIMLSLQSLKESSPICPPVQSVVGGLLKLVDTYEIAVQNETDRRRLYERVDAIQGSLEAAWGDTDIREFCLSEVQLAALETLNVNMQSLLGVASQLSLTRIRHWAHRLALRFILARAHKDQITVLHTALAHMDDDFRRTLELDTNRRMNLVQKNINSVLSTSSTNHLALLSEFHRLQTIISIGLAGLFV